MAFSWNDLVAKTDLFNKVLPQYKDGALQNTINVKLTALANKAKFNALISHVDGEKSLGIEFTDAYPKYKNTELGFKFSTKKAVELTAKVTDDVIPLTGASFLLNISAKEQDEKISGIFGYVDKHFNGKFGIHFPLSHKLVDLPSDKASDSRIVISDDLVVRPFLDQDIYLGLQSALEVPKDQEAYHYDIKAALVTKNDKFEGGVYGRRGIDREKGALGKVGVYSTTENDGIIAGAHAAYDLHAPTQDFKGFSFETYASFPASQTDRCLTSLQIIPDATLSVGYEKVVNKNTKLSFGFAYVLSAGKSKTDKFKQNAFNFNLELSH